MERETRSLEELAQLAGAPVTDKTDNPLAALVAEDEAAQAPATPEKRPLWASPFAKAGVVGTGTMMLVGIGSLFFGGFSLPAKQQGMVIQPQPAMAAQTGEDPEGKLLAEIALGRQAGELEKLQQSQEVPEAPPAAPATKLPPPPPRVASLPPPPVRPISAPPVFSASVEQEDPTSAWKELSQLGSYGQAYQDERRSSPSRSRNSVAQAGGASVQIDAQAEQAFYSGRARKNAVVGTSTTGLLTTPVVYESNNQALGLLSYASGSRTNETTADEEDRFVILLTQPLVSQDRSEALPAGTQVIAKVDKLSRNGLIRMSGVAVLVEGGNEIPLPQGALTIRGDGGGPLYARNVNDRGPEIASMDIGQYAVAGAAKAAEQYTRPLTQSVVSSIGGVSSATSYGAPNLIAGFIQGGSEALERQLQQRNQQAIRETLSRPNIWMLPAGTPVQIFLNKSISNI